MKRLLKFPFFLALALFMTAAFAAKDPADNPGTADHPEVVRFPGFHIDSSKRTDFNEFRFATEGYDGSYEPKGEVKAGKHWFIDYILNDNARKPSPVELIRNYENVFKKAGGTLVKRHADPESAVYRMPMGQGGERWMQINIDNEGMRYQLNIVDVGAMPQKVEFSAGEMATAIKKNGFVALNGILFDTGKATIKPESMTLLTEVVSMLKADKGLRLSVEGHTDNVGDKRANAELSKKRAESVVRHLTDHGVEAKRLKAEGKGDGVPVADNRTEEGRAKNRRVELVKF